MYKIYNAFNVKEAIKTAGGRWNGDEKCWNMTDEQFSSLPEGALEGCRVESDTTVVSEMETGATFRFVASGEKVLAQAEDGRVFAWWKKTITLSPRGTATSYDRHRITKGDLYDYDAAYAEGGDTARVLEIARAALPKAFTDAKWTLGPDADEYEVFEFVSGLVPGGCAWFGNTDKKVVAAVKRAQKTMTFQSSI